MGKYIIEGGNKLKGEISINGSKNAVLPILSAALINCGENIIENCPDITDVHFTCEILKDLGCSVKKEGNRLIINSKNATNKSIKKDVASKMRSSILFMGVILGKFGNVVISKPGGCAIGERPIDIHLDALRQMGARIIEKENTIECKADKLLGTKIHLPMASVGATENIMLASVFAKGETKIYNCAREPEIFALQEFLKGIGVNVYGAGSNEITVVGTTKFNDCTYSVIADRIEAGTFLLAAMATKGEVFLKNVDWLHMGKTLEILSDLGGFVKEVDEGLYLKSPKKIKSIPLITTGVYPAFPTDMQPLVMSVLTISKGTSIIIEKMFENRFEHCKELIKMGGKISAQSKVVIIEGVNCLQGNEVNATDLRAGAALIIAGLAAEGKTVVNNGKYVLRGYENFDERLRSLGLNIKFEETNDGDSYGRRILYK